MPRRSSDIIVGLDIGTTKIACVVGEIGPEGLRAAAGEALGVGAGIAKELWDLDGHGDPSWRDLTWDLIGATTGVLVSVAFDWAVHRIFNWPVGRQSR